MTKGELAKQAQDQANAIELATANQADMIAVLKYKLVTGAQATPVPQEFAITSASDWPMFLIMGSAVIGLGLYIWRDLKSDINSHRANSEKACKEYRAAIWEQINGPLWTAIAECCPRMTHEDLMALKEKILCRVRECDEHEDTGANTA